MTICSFIGHHRILEKEVYERLRQAIDQVIQSDDEIEFWFYYPCAFNFQVWGLSSLCDLKAQYPEKTIRICAVFDGRNCEKPEPLFRVKEGQYVPCSVDRAIPVIDHHMADLRNWSRIKRWMISKSDCVICYVYPERGDVTRNLEYEFAKENGARILDIAG